MPTITYQCPNEECEADHEIDFHMEGRYLAATLYEPAEYSEPCWDSDIILKCDECGHQLTDDERSDLRKEVQNKIDNFDHDGYERGRIEDDYDYDDRRSNFGMW